MTQLNQNATAGNEYLAGVWQRLREAGMEASMRADTFSAERESVWPDGVKFEHAKRVIEQTSGDAKDARDHELIFAIFFVPVSAFQR